MKIVSILTSALLVAFVTISACTLFQPIKTDPADNDSEDPVSTISGNSNFDYWIHSPLHPGNNRSVTFKSKISDAVGFSTIELHVFEYELFLNEDQLPSRRKRANGQWGKVKTWEANGDREMTISYNYQKGFPKESEVEYIFKAVDIEGRVTERVAFFDAGDSPWPQDKILLYSASREDLTQTFNLCFFPDVDFKGNWNSFLDDSHSLIFDGFHQSNVMSGRKERWAFYYTRQEADGLKIAQEFDVAEHYPAFMKEDLITGIDAFALLHKTPYSDGSYMYGNIHFLSQNVFTTESYNHGTAIHEMGHSVFQLSDEYNGCACFQPSEGYSNVFRSEEACLDFQKEKGLVNQHCHRIYSYDQQYWFTPEENVYFPTENDCRDYNKKNGYTEANCITFIDVDGTQTYRAEEGLCIMNDDGDTKIYPFQEACMAVVNDYYSRFGGVLLASNRKPPVLRENMFGYEPVVYLTLAEKNGKWVARVNKIAYGVPNKKTKKGDAATVHFLDNNNNTIYALEVDHPGEGHFCGGSAPVRTKFSKVVKCMVAVPYSENLKAIVIQNIIENQVQQTKEAETQRIDITKQLQKAAALFKSQ